MLLVTLTASCASMKGEATATERELCIQWGSALPTRSSDDTAQTRDEITKLYASFALSCPAFTYLLPK